MSQLKKCKLKYFVVCLPQEAIFVIRQVKYQKVDFENFCFP
jgi:hypothetical protein